MAKFAKRLVAAQGLDGVVEVIQGVIESVDIPEKVDIIISEWMVSRGGGGAGGGGSCTAAVLAGKVYCWRLLGKRMQRQRLLAWPMLPPQAHAATACHTPAPPSHPFLPARATSCCARACWTA